MSEQDPAPLPGIDMADALGRLGGNRALLERVYGDFCRQYAGAAGEIGRLAATGAANEAAAMAHAVKGVAGNIGAKRIYAAARDLEAALLKSGNWGALLGPLDEALRELGAPPAAPQPSIPVTGGATRIDRAKFIAAADALRPLLQARDLDAEDRLAALRAVCPSGPQLDALAGAIDALDYRAALDHLAALEQLVLGASAR